MALTVHLFLRLHFTSSLQSHIPNCLSAYLHPLPSKINPLPLSSTAFPFSRA